MAYRQPEFLLDHLGASRSLSDIVALNLTDANIRRLIDRRQGSLAVWSTSSASHHFRIDMGEQYSPTTLIIPAGHNLDGIDLDIYSDPDATWVGPIFRSTHTVSGSGVIEHELGSPSRTDRIYQINFDGTGTWELSEVWYGIKQALSATAYVDPRFEFNTVSQTIETAYPGGNAIVDLAPPRREFTLEIRNVDPSSADWTLLDAIATQGRSESFWYWPPDDTDPGPFLVQLERDPDVQQDHPAPSVSLSYRVRLRMVEVAV